MATIVPTPGRARNGLWARPDGSLWVPGTNLTPEEAREHAEGSGYHQVRLVSVKPHKVRRTKHGIEVEGITGFFDLDHPPFLGQTSYREFGEAMLAIADYLDSHPNNRQRLQTELEKLGVDNAGYVARALDTAGFHHLNDDPGLEGGE